MLKLRKMLEDEACQKERLEGEIAILHSQLLQISFDADEVCQVWNLKGCVEFNFVWMISLDMLP